MRDAPEALREWANGLVEQDRRRQSRRPTKRVIAGWEWDGVSADIKLLMAPSGKAHREIPDDVWAAMSA
jgi:hypothetical protein